MFPHLKGISFAAALLLPGLGFAQTIYTIDRSTGELVLAHPAAPANANPVARLPINFGIFSNQAGASVEATSGFDLALDDNRLFALKYVPGGGTPTVFLIEINPFSGDVVNHAQVVDANGQPLSAAAEGLAHDGTNLIMGYHEASTGIPVSESNSLVTLDTAGSFGTMGPNTGFHAGNPAVDTDGLTACGDEIIGVDNADNGTFNQRGVYDMGTAASPVYVPAGFLQGSGTSIVTDVGFTADAKIAVLRVRTH